MNLTNHNSPTTNNADFLLLVHECFARARSSDLQITLLREFMATRQHKLAGMMLEKILYEQTQRKSA